MLVLHTLCCAPKYMAEMRGMQNFDWKAWRKESTWKA